MKGGWGYVVLTITVIVQCISHGLHMSSGIIVSAIISRFRENLLTAGKCQRYHAKSAAIRKKFCSNNVLNVLFLSV